MGDLFQNGTDFLKSVEDSVAHSAEVVNSLRGLFEEVTSFANRIHIALSNANLAHGKAIVVKGQVKQG